MEQRVKIHEAQSAAWKAMYNFSISISNSVLTPIQKELIKIRASQINSCAYCINMHTEEALKIGETQQRIFLISAWRETDLFTPEEKAILALTEEVTLIHDKGVSDATYKEAEQFFNSEAIAEIIIAITVINSWNRIAVSTRLPIGH
ncbi:MAG: carboxymuconolactone decarboxylase family protein [Chitinophagaceae bacterium]|nr:carboxymuconolactone decarboxylase family protein [Chitinophagaceae bacterium]